MNREAELAYLAGVIDSDGTVGIKRSTYHMRVLRDATNPLYSERIAVKQVEPQAVRLAKRMFGGYLGVQRASAKKGKPLFVWQTTDLKAAKCAKEVLPFARIKRRQLELLIRLRELKQNTKKQSIRYWWELEHPGWRDEERFVTTQEASELLGWKQPLITQAVRKGTIPAKHGPPHAGHHLHLIPLSFIQKYDIRRMRPRRHGSWIAECEALRLQIMRLNKTGV